jgi:hypothetical protein
MEEDAQETYQPHEAAKGDGIEEAEPSGSAIFNTAA